MRILLIEDEPGIVNVVRLGLQQAQYVVDVAMDGKAGLEKALTESYAAIVMDLMLPGMDGWQICEELRDRSIRTPILMLTARGAVEDRVKGLELGADDYLPKPFEFTELLARVRALVRRDRVHRSRNFRVGDLQIDTAERRVTRAGVEIHLTHREYELLEALASHEGQVLSRETILERVWMDEDSFSNTVDVYIGMLRKKIDADHAQKLIQTIRGAGYAIRRPDRGDL
ncbi:MAG: response regulator transcription factor [Chthonomonadales bacterium]